MDPYSPDPVPTSREHHNRLMNAAVIQHRVPLTLVCPDCYQPPRMCRHLLEEGMACLFHPWPGDPPAKK